MRRRRSCTSPWARGRRASASPGVRCGVEGGLGQQGADPASVSFEGPGRSGGLHCCVAAPLIGLLQPHDHRPEAWRVGGRHRHQFRLGPRRLLWLPFGLVGVCNWP